MLLLLTATEQYPKISEHLTTELSEIRTLRLPMFARLYCTPEATRALYPDHSEW